MASAGQLFEQGCLVGLFGAQKVGKGVLCQYHGACKLLVGKPHGLVDARLQLCLVHHLMFGGELCELAFGRGYGAAALYTHAPRGLVGVALGGGEGHAHPALLLSAAQYAGRVGGLHLLCLVGDEFEVVGRYALHVVETGRTVVKCQADGVEYGALARAYIACYGKEAG